MVRLNLRREHRLQCIKNPCEEWDELPTSTGFLAGKHQLVLIQLAGFYFAAMGVDYSRLPLIQCRFVRFFF